MDKVRTLSLILSLLFASLSTAVAQNENGQKDSLVRLIEANAAKLIDRELKSYLSEEEWKMLAEKIKE